MITKILLYLYQSSIIIDDSCVRATMIVLIMTLQLMVLVITFEHIRNADGDSIQSMPIFPSSIFKFNITNTTSIEDIAVGDVTGEFVCNHHPQLEEHDHTIVSLIQQQWVATPKWMQLTTSSVITKQKLTRIIHIIYI